MANDNQKWISIMIVPEDGTGMQKWRITARRFSLMKKGLWAIGALLCIGLISLTAVGVLMLKVDQYRKLNAELLDATTMLNTIDMRLERYEEKERQLRSLIGSDLNIPDPVVAADGDSLPAMTGVSPDGSPVTELDNAISVVEEKNRRYPTSWPVEAWQISKGFIHTGEPRTDHPGIDILAPRKTHVMAAGSGQVTFAGTDSDLGLMVIIDHQNGWETHYGHNESVLVSYGDQIRKGQPVAVFGGSGTSSTGDHLHFGMYYDGQPLNPIDWLDKRPLVNLTKQ